MSVAGRAQEEAISCIINTYGQEPVRIISFFQFSGKLVVHNMRAFKSIIANNFATYFTRV
jgi:hypothetical protein